MEGKTELEKTKTFIQLIYIFVPNVTIKDKEEVRNINILFRSLFLKFLGLALPL